MSVSSDGKNMVVMHNQLARHVILERMTSLSVQDQRVIAYLIATGIKNHANSDMPVEVEGSVAELAAVCGVTAHNKFYQTARQATESLMKHLIRFKDPEDGKDVSCTWLAWGKYHPKEGRFTVEFPKPLRKVLTDLSKHRTEIALETLLGLGGSAYTLRLYQLCKSWQSNKGFIVSCDDLRGQLGVPKDTYERAIDFRRNVLDTPLKSINSKSDIRVIYVKANKGKEWRTIAFTIEPKVDETGAKKLKPRVKTVTDLPIEEQVACWQWLRSQLAGSELPEVMDWSQCKTPLEKILRYWNEEKAQGKLPL